MHVPLKVSKSSRRRSSNPQLASTASPLDTPIDISSTPESVLATGETPRSLASGQSPELKITDSETRLLSSLALQEEDDDVGGGLSSESEYVLSDPSGFRSPGDSSPDRKVQFHVGSNNIDDIPEDGQEKGQTSEKRHRRK